MLELSPESTLARDLVAGGVFVVAMGLSRVFLGHHWLSDVVMGWVLGLAWLCVVGTAHRLYLTVRRARGEAASPQADAAGRSTTQWSPSSRKPRRW